MVIKIPPLDFTNLPNENFHDYFIKETNERKNNIELGFKKDLSMQESAVNEYKIFENIIKKNRYCNILYIVIFSTVVLIIVIIVVVFYFLFL